MKGMLTNSVSVVSALLLSAAYPPYDYNFLAWVGLAPLLYVLRKTGLLASACLSLIAGILFYTLTFSWAGAIVEIGVLNWLLFMVAPLSLYFLIFGVLYTIVSRKIGHWNIIIAPSLWVALEYVRSNLFFLALPWNLLAHSQYRNLLFIQIADITGVYGVSFVIVMVNQLISQFPEFPAFRKILFKSERVIDQHTNSLFLPISVVAVALAIVVSYGGYKRFSNSEKHIRVALIQANLLTRDNMPYAEQVTHLRGYEQLTREAVAEEPDLIVWPASSLPAAIRASRLVRHTIVQLARETKTYLLVGGAGYEKLGPNPTVERVYSNSEFLISPSGHLNGQYDKIRLLPFNEYVPLRGKIKWPAMIAAIRKDFMPGDVYTIFKVADGRFGTPICWENLFPDHFRRFVKEGANFMVSVTNEGFYGPTAAPHQTLAINVFRAVENRVAVARAATTGVSAFIDPDGKIAERVQDESGKDLFVSGFIVRDIPLSDKKTFYTNHGDIFAYAAISIALLSVLVSFAIYKREAVPKKMT